MNRAVVALTSTRSLSSSALSSCCSLLVRALSLT
jgi:hypothetical protein